jgi:uncharacterized membrane protein YgcG
MNKIIVIIGLSAAALMLVGAISEVIYLPQHQAYAWCTPCNSMAALSYSHGGNGGGGGRSYTGGSSGSNGADQTIHQAQ